MPRTLRDRIAREKRLAPADAARVLGEVLQQLAEAHAQELVHRGLLPERILVEDGRARVTDFCVDDGAPPYASPEQIRGEAPDARSDLYAVGAIAYELVSGRAPFEAPTPSERIRRQLDGRLAPLDELPPALAALIARALDPDPARRPQTATALAADLAACVAAVPAPLDDDLTIRNQGVPVPVAEQETVRAALGPAFAQRTLELEAPARPHDTVPYVPVPIAAAPTTDRVAPLPRAGSRQSREESLAATLVWLMWIAFGVAGGLALHLVRAHR
jgi:serine/threonine-protein kinase